MTRISDVDDAIAAAEFGSDEQAALWVERGEILGHALHANHLAHRFGITEKQADAILHRLVAKGMIEEHPHHRLDPVRRSMRGWLPHERRYEQRW